VNFPLRPGVTKFAFNYDLPYAGHATFQTKGVYALQQLAVMIPTTMKFTSQSPAFQTLPAGNNNYQVQAANQVKAGERPAFEISGVGALPAQQAARTRPKPSSSTPSSPAPSTPSSRLQWWFIVTGAVLLLGTCGFLLWDRQRLSANATTVAQKIEQPRQSPVPLVEALKEELFQLEIALSHGTISGEEYTSAKQALEGTVKWALARNEVSGGAT